MVFSNPGHVGIHFAILEVVGIDGDNVRLRGSLGEATIKLPVEAKWMCPGQNVKYLIFKAEDMEFAMGFEPFDDEGEA